MQISLMKKTLIKHAAIGAVVSGVFVGIYFMVNSYTENAEKELQKIKSNASQLSANIKKSETQITSLKDAVDSYDTIQEQRLPQAERLDNGAQRIRAARSVLNPLKEKYKLKALDVTFEQIDALEKPSKESAFDIANSKILVTFAASSDEIAFSLIYDMIEQFKGYVHLRRLTLKKAENAWETVLSANAAANGSAIDPFDFVTGEAELAWITIEGKPINVEALKKLDIKGLAQ